MKENDEDSDYVRDAIENYLDHCGLDAETYSLEKPTKARDLIVELNTEWGMARPRSGRGGCIVDFTYPKYVTVEFFDSISKKKLLKTTYSRGFWADVTIDGESWNYTVIIIKDIDKTLGVDIVNQDYRNSCPYYGR